MADVERMDYFKTIRNPKELDEIPIDILKELYLQAVTDLDEFKKEHNIMKRFIYTNGLWNRFLNYDAFIDHLRNDSITKEVIKKC
jgi:hypothetical protein